MPTGVYKHKSRPPEVRQKIGENSRFTDSCYIAKEKIAELYIKSKLPIHKVAEKLNTSYGVILRRMVRYGIPRRKQGTITN